MTCQEFLSLLPQYPDAMPDEDTRSAFLAHAAECPDCATLLADQEALLASLGALDNEIELPPHFHQGWMDVIEAEGPPAHTPRMRRWQAWAVAAAAVVCVLGGTSLMRRGILFPGASKNDSLALQDSPSAAARSVDAERGEGGAADKSAPMILYEEEAPAAEPMEDAVLGGESAAPAIILRSASISIDSQMFDADMDRLQGLLHEHGGWVEYQSVQGQPLTGSGEEGRFAYLRLRVPEGALDTFLSALSDIGAQTNSQLSSEDISATYYDTQARLDMYAAQRDRLVALYEQAETTSDIIEIEDRLSEVQYTIDSLGGRIASWDSQAKSASVTLSLTEVAPEAKSSEITLGERLSTALSNSIRGAQRFAADLLVFLIMAAPYLLCGGLVIVCGIFLFRTLRYRTRKKRRNPNEKDTDL